MIARLLGPSVLLAALLGSIFCSPTAQAAQLALVIGNDAYQQVPRLERAVGDAQAIGTALRSLGYAVTIADDLDFMGMTHAVADFAARVQPGDSVVFQFSGHGVAIDGRNYLLPVDVEQPHGGDEAAVESLSLDAARITAELMRNRPKLVFAILDACRNNPFQGTGRSLGSDRGLARMDAAPGEFILFSAGPGEEALDRLGDADRETTSVFTRVLLGSLTRPGMTLQKLAKATQAGVTQLAATIHREQFPDYFDRTVDEPVLSQGPAAIPQAPAATDCASPLLGTWTNIDPQARTVDHLVISAVCSGGRPAFAVEAFGRCTPSPCPWGVRPARPGPQPGSLASRFDFSFATTNLAVTLLPDRRLGVATATRYTDKSGRKPRSNSDMLALTGAAP